LLVIRFVFLNKNKVALIKTHIKQRKTLMKNIKTSLLTLAFLSVSGFAALSMEDDKDNNSNITLK
jgi:hypothetical protein